MATHSLAHSDLEPKTAKQLVEDIRALAQDLPASSPIQTQLALMCHAIETDAHWQVLTEHRDLSPQEAARFLGVSRPYVVNKFIKTGLLKASKVGTHYRIKPEDLQDFLSRKAMAERDVALALASPTHSPEVSFTAEELDDL